MAPETTPHTPHLPRPSRRQLIALGAGTAALGCSATRDREAGAQELFGNLHDQRGSIEAITSEERAGRRRRLGELLTAAGIDAFFCEGGATMSYLSGMRWGRSERVFGLVVRADGTHLWICPEFEAGRARLGIEDGPGGELVTWEEHEYARGALARVMQDQGLERWAVDPGARLLAVDELRAASATARIESAPAIVGALRGVKDEHELALLRRANELTQEAILAASEHVRPGMTRDEIAPLIRTAQERLGLRDVWVLALVGPAAAYPHGNNSEVTLGRGDFLLVDTGGSLHGYQSDNTRTWVPDGQPGREETRAWHAVHAAQRRAFEAIRPGVVCAEIDRVARASLDAAGYGPDYHRLTHRLGHGIGMEGHEQPYFDLGSEVVLQPGMTLSNEPGIYVPGSFGVRLEDIVAVTASGAEHFGNWQAGPTSPASTAPTSI